MGPYLEGPADDGEVLEPADRWGDLAVGRPHLRTKADGHTRVRCRAEGEGEGEGET